MTVLGVGCGHSVGTGLTNPTTAPAGGEVVTAATPTAAGPGPTASPVLTGSPSTATVPSTTPDTITTTSKPLPCQNGTMTVSGEEGTEPSPRCLVVGARLIVTLTMSSTAGGSYWLTPSSSDDAVLMRMSDGPAAAGRATAAFDALSAGRAVVSATTDATCFHVQPRCEMASFVWRLPVTVVRA
jgi:hypothetical protein